MLARTLTTLPSSAELARYSLEAKSDGHRLITFTGSEGVLLQTRRGDDATRAFPDIARAGAGVGELDLDGVMRALGCGTPCLSRERAILHPGVSQNLPAGDASCRPGRAQAVPLLSVKMCCRG